MINIKQANQAFVTERFGTAGYLYKEVFRKYPALRSALFWNLKEVKKRAAEYRYQLLADKHYADYLKFLPFSLRVLFVLPGPLNSNNGYHVQYYAHFLERCGVRCVFAVDDAFHDKKDFGIYSYTFLRDGYSGSFDIIHAWTPRERVRKLCDEMVRRHACPVIVHLEDNEKYLTEVLVGNPFDELEKMPLAMLDTVIPENCYHPLRGQKFLANASGLTMIIDTLRNFALERQPNLILPPPVDEQLFFSRPLNIRLRHEFGISDNAIVFVYTGNVHPANCQEVLELYQAIELLNKEGYHALLLRTGTNAENVHDENWDSRYVKALGWVERDHVPDILAAADIFVQPGTADDFNNKRIPSKLPEFFSIGRPVVLPKTNLGLSVRHGIDAYVVENADATGIFNAVVQIEQSKELKEQLSLGAVDFYREQFCGNQSVADLLHFYICVSSKFLKIQKG